jgi:hypothetical protein
MSRILRLGDTFEVYAVKNRSVRSLGEGSHG